MANHVRRQIREAVVTALTGLTTTGSRVYSGRSRTLAVNHSPTLLVYSIDEESDIEAIGSDPILMRRLTLVVEGRAVATGDDAGGTLEDTLDQIAKEVEPAVTRNAGVLALATEVTLTATRITVQSPGEVHAGEIRFEFRVFYRTRESAPDVAV